MPSSFKVAKVRRSAGDVPLQIRVKRSYLSFEMLFCFFLPLLTLIRLPLGGSLLGSDLALFLILPVILTNPRRFNLRQSFLPQLLILLGLWSLGAIVSDFLAHSTLVDIIRSQASIWTLAGYIFCFFVVIDGKEARYVAALVGISVSALANNLLGIGFIEGGGFFGAAWKFGNGQAVTILTIVFLKQWLPSRKSQGLIAIGFSLVHLALNSRALFLRTFLAGTAATFSFRGLGRAGRFAAGGVILVFAFVLYPLAENMYGNVVMSGTFGDEVKLKYEEQTNLGLGTLLGGRSEALISLRAIAEKPLFGFGSYAKDSSLRLEYFQILEGVGKNIDWNSSYVRESETIPAHSFLLGSWVSNGIFGALFWIYVFLLAFRAVLAGAFGPQPAGPVELLVLFLLLWSILFSPFGFNQRIFVSVFIAISQILIKRNN